MDFLQSLKRYSVFRLNNTDVEICYLDSVTRIDRINSFMGVCFFRRDFNLFNPIFAWGVTTLFTYIYLVISTAYWYRNDIDKILMCITTVGFSFQMASKIYTFIITRTRVIEINELNLKYFNFGVTKHNTVQMALKQSSALSHILITMTIIAYIILVGLIGLGPIAYGLATTQKILSFGFEIFHSDYWPAYSINCIYQVNCAYFVALMTITSDGTFILFLLTASGHIDAISELLLELNDMMKARVNESNIDEQLARIIQLHQHHQHYMRKVENLFNCYFLIAIASLCFCMSICLAAFVLVNWYIGVVVFCFTSSQIFYMCFLGTHLQTKSELLALEVSSFDWYKLSVHNQKSVLLLLVAAQNPINLTAIMEKLNVATYLQIHKSVYSVLMLLLRMKE